MVLVDTSVWIEYFKNGNVKLVSLLENSLVVMHPYVLSELYIGGVSKESRVFDYLELLPRLDLTSYHEFKAFVDEYSLKQKKVGFVDCCLLSAAFKSNASLYTLDKSLQFLADKILK